MLQSTLVVCLAFPNILGVTFARSPHTYQEVFLSVAGRMKFQIYLIRIPLWFQVLSNRLETPVALYTVKVD
jgi:hypothetical protein